MSWAVVGLVLGAEWAVCLLLAPFLLPIARFAPDLYDRMMSPGKG